MSMKTARHLTNNQTAAWGGYEHICYVQQEPTNLMSQVGTDLVLSGLIGSMQCLGAWEVESIAIADKPVSLCAWILCDVNNGADSMLVRVERIVQLQHCKST